ncbi:MAG: hypothetical protein WCR52_18475, partial [Bacteroidota bacterium]
MKKLLARLILLGLLFLGNQFSLISAPKLPEIVVETPPGCALPTPSSFGAGTITDNSIQFVWTPPPAVPPGTTVTYKLSLTDISNGTVYPDKYTTALTFLYDLLPSGHYFSATISASACGQTGPFGPTFAPVIVHTNIIIVDDIASLGENICIPGGTTDVLQPNEVITITLPSGGGYINQNPPIGHFIFTDQKNSSLVVDFNLTSLQGFAKFNEPHAAPGLTRLPVNPQQAGNGGGPGPVHGFTDVTYKNGDQLFLKVYDPTTTTNAPGDVFLKIMAGTGLYLRSCGVTYIHGASNGGDHLLGGVKDFNAIQNSNIPSSNNDRNGVIDENTPLQSIQLTPNPT